MAESARPQLRELVKRVALVVELRLCAAAAAEHHRTRPRSCGLTAEPGRVLAKGSVCSGTGDRIAIALGRRPGELWPQWFC